MLRELLYPLRKKGPNHFVLYYGTPNAHFRAISDELSVALTIFQALHAYIVPSHVSRLVKRSLIRKQDATKEARLLAVPTVTTVEEYVEQ